MAKNINGIVIKHLQRFIVIAIVLTILPKGAIGEDVLVELGSPMIYKANQSDPGFGLDWVQEGFDDSAWETGTYGVGFKGENLVETEVPTGSLSVYTRAEFVISDVSQVNNLFLGVDFDDGYVAWINGVEIHREGVPAETLWNSRGKSHESSNGPIPDYEPVHDISSIGISALRTGVNVLAIGVWNVTAVNSDLVVVPKLSMNRTLSLSRGPYLQMGTPTSMVVKWRTTTSVDSRVRYGNTPGDLTSVVDDANPTREHEVTLTDLTPSTKYFYSIGTSEDVFAGDDADHFFITPPPVGDSQPTRIWVLGDSGTANDNARSVRDAYYDFNGTAYTDLWLTLGDNAYRDGSDNEFQKALFEMYPEVLIQTPLWPSFGNHDGHTADSKTQTGPYYRIFSLPKSGEAGGVPSGTEAYYSFDYGNMHFICLDSNESDRSPDGKMMAWLQQDLSTNTNDWLIAFWHHAPYTKGFHDSDTEARLVEMRENFLPVLESGGADLVLGGHSHSYERTFLLDGHYDISSTLGEEMKVDGGDGREDGTGAYRKPTLGPSPHQGTVYVVAGSSGVTSKGDLNHPAMFISHDKKGSLILDVDGNTLTAKFLDSKGIIQDNFTIEKGEMNPGATTLDVRVETREDDAEERISGKTETGSADLEKGFGSEGSKGDQIVGLRFNNISIPQGAIILKAYVQFTTDEKRSMPTSLTIHGEASDNAEVFARSDFNISSRLMTAASVAWSPDPWTTVGGAGLAERTPDISPVIQEIADRQGWSKSNSMALAITGTGQRVSVAYGENRTEMAALLHIEYANGSISPPPAVTINEPQDGDMFNQGDTITLSGAATDNVDGDLANDLVWESDLDGMLGTGTSVIQSDLSVGTHMITASVTDSDGLPGSDKMTVIINNAEPQTLEIRVDAREDDAEERISGKTETGSADLEKGFGSEGSKGDQIVGLRFNNISIPQGATILQAYVQFTTDETRSMPTSLTIHGEASDNAKVFARSDFNISSRLMTAASVAWSPDPWTTVGGAGLAERTPDISPLVQEIVHRQGWSNSNSMALAITGTGQRVSVSYSKNRAEMAALLHIEYIGN